MQVKIFFNRTYKNSINLIYKNIKCNCFNISKNNDGKELITIGNITIVNKDNIINSIEFLHYNYISKIQNFNKGKIYSTNLIFDKKNINININNLKKFIDEIQ